MTRFLLVCSFFVYSCNPSAESTDRSNPALEENIEIDGSSTVYPIAEAVAEEYSRDKNVGKITIGVSGTGGGIKKFSRNEIDIANASRPIKKTEDSTCRAHGIVYMEIPIAFDGLAVVVNKNNTWINSLTVKQLKMIWEPEAQGKIKNWNQIDPTWPDEEIHLYGAGTQSGTFDYFTEAIVGKAKSCRGDYTASEDDNVLIQGISTDENSLGFFGLDYYVSNPEKLKLVPIDDEKEENGKGPISPTEATVKGGTYQPLSRPLLIYINIKSLDRPAVSNFVKYFITNAPALVAEAGYVPLTERIYGLVMKRFVSKKTGSLFLSKSSSVGVKMEELLKD